MIKRLVVISDIHGRYKSLGSILKQLNINFNYKTAKWDNPNNYQLVFLGDIADHGGGVHKHSIICLQIVKSLCDSGIAICIMSNHLDKLKRWLNGNNVKLTHGLASTVREFDSLCNGIMESDSKFSYDQYKLMWYNWIDNLPLYYYFIDIDNKSYILSHAYFDDNMYRITQEDDFEVGAKKTDWFKSKCIYGRQKDHARFIWWEEEGYDIEHFNLHHYIVGHLHIHKRGYNYTILDTDDNSVMYYIPSENIIEKVSNE